MKILFVGAGGSGMGALVRWHSELGDALYTQDDGISPAELLKRYPNAKSFSKNEKIVFDRAVFSDAIPTAHPLRAYAANNKIPVRSYAEELGALSEGRHVIAVAGTHGKSTTTALISWVLATAKLDPLCIIGAEIKAWNGGFRFGNGPVIVEADEFKRHFLHLRPTVVLVTSLEADHFDTYANENELVEAFAQFCSQKSVQSVFVARGSLALDHLSEELAKQGRSHVRFGNDDDMVRSRHFEISNSQSHASILVNEESQDFRFQSVTCPHISNLLGAVAVLTHAGIPPELLKEGIGSFPGILRRLELLGEVDNVPIYSDYAHHPTAVRETLRMLRKIFSDATIGVIFEPHERLRTSTLLNQYQDSFVDANIIGLLPVYDPVGRERPDISDLAVALSPSGDVTQLANYNAAFAWVREFATTDSNHKILIIMGAGPVDGAFRKRITDQS